MKNKIKKFFNKEFLTFCFIGFVAYLVHQICYLFYLKMNFFDDHYHLISTAFAFTIASIVSLILNAKFTYNEKLSKNNVIKSTLFFIFKFILTEFFCLSIMIPTRRFINDSSFLFIMINKGLPLILTCLTLFLQFIFFNHIFKKKGEHNANNQ